MKETNKSNPIRVGKLYCCPGCLEPLQTVTAPSKYYEHLICQKCDRNWVHHFEEKES